MVRYRAIDATVSLSLASIDATTTDCPITCTGKDLAAHLQSVSNELKKGAEEQTLSEFVIPEDGEIPFHLRFLGPHQDMPFYLVRISRSTSNKANRSRIHPLSTGISALASSPSTTPELLSHLAGTENGVETPILPPDQERCGQNLENSHNIHSNHSSPKNDRFRTQKGANCVPWGVMPSPEKDASPQCANFDTALYTPLNEGFAISPTRRLFLSPSLQASHGGTSTKMMTPHALCVTVQLSRQSFLQLPLPGMTGKNKPLDVKIDIFFNGELCASSFIPQRMRVESNVAELTQRFTGRRIDRLLERPWILVPSGRNACEPTRESGGTLGASCEGRWDEINTCLRAEAEKGGRNKWGDLGVLGTYLSSLASFAMPKELQDTSVVGGPSFGVIDVILTAGHGKKDDAEAGYLCAPTPIRIIEPPKSRIVQKKLRNPIYRSVKPASEATRSFPRPKVYPDAEIIASGFQPFLGPRLSRTATPSLAESVVNLKGPSGAPVANTSNSKTSRGLLPVPTASQRRRLSNLTFTENVANSSKVITLTAQRRDTLIDRIHRGDHSPLVIKSGVVLDTPEKFTEADNDLDVSTPVSTASEQRIIKRRKFGVPPTIQACNDKNLETSNYFIRQRQPPSSGRVRSSVGRFATTAPVVKARLPSGRPMDVPQKTYKGAEADSEKQRQDQLPLISEPSIPKLTLVEEIEAIQRAAVEQELNRDTAVNVGGSPYATRLATPRRFRILIPKPTPVLAPSTAQVIKYLNDSSGPTVTSIGTLAPNLVTSAPFVFSDQGTRRLFASSEDTTKQLGTPARNAPVSIPLDSAVQCPQDLLFPPGDSALLANTSMPVTPVPDASQRKRLILKFRHPNPLKVSPNTKLRVEVIELDSRSPSPLTPLDKHTPESSFGDATPSIKKRHFSRMMESSSDNDGDNHSVYGTPTGRPRAMPRARIANVTETPKAESSTSTKTTTPILPVTPGTDPKKRLRLSRAGVPLWEAGDVNKDCVIGYAPGMLRQVRAERGGWFQESSILMGVRFVLGRETTHESSESSESLPESEDSFARPSDPFVGGSISLNLSFDG